MRKLLLIVASICWLQVSFAAPSIALVESQKLATSGARQLIPFELAGANYIAVTQLAKDIPNTKANMNGGNADVPIVVYKSINGVYEPYQRIPSHGNESGTFFKMGDKAYLAVASIHSGPKPPFNTHAYSKLYVWDGKYFVPQQQFYGFAAKSVKAFRMGDDYFLGIANGVVPPSGKSENDTRSVLYKWDGKQFEPFQYFPTQWAYDWHFFQLDGKYYLGLTDHLKQSVLYRWNGQQFKSFQTFPGNGGRVFKHFKIDSEVYLAYANIANPSTIYRWNGKKFLLYQTLEDLGGRNFVYFTRDKAHYLFRVNFITGERGSPNTVLQSTLYQWKDKKFTPIQNITTYGGVSAALFNVRGKSYLAVANSLSKDIRFRVDSVIYEIKDKKSSGE